MHLFVRQCNCADQCLAQQVLHCILLSVNIAEPYSLWKRAEGTTLCPFISELASGRQ